MASSKGKKQTGTDRDQEDDEDPRSRRDPGPVQGRLPGLVAPCRGGMP